MLTPAEQALCHRLASKPRSLGLEEVAVRQAAMDAHIPWLNIVQASSWTPAMRVPNADELRYLVYTTLAYGAQGISYYVYTAAGHDGGG